MNNIAWQDAFIFGIGMCYGMVYLHIKEYLKTKDFYYILGGSIYVILSILFYFLHFFLKK